MQHKCQWNFPVLNPWLYPQQHYVFSLLLPSWLLWRKWSWTEVLEVQHVHNEESGVYHSPATWHVSVCVCACARVCAHACMPEHVSVVMVIPPFSDFVVPQRGTRIRMLLLPCLHLLRGGLPLLNAEFGIRSWECIPHLFPPFLCLGICLPAENSSFCPPCHQLDRGWLCSPPLSLPSSERQSNSEVEY